MIINEIASQSHTVTRRKRHPAVRHEARQVEALNSMAEGALHITVYDLLAQAYNRVAIQYYHQQGDVLVRNHDYYSPLNFTPALPGSMREEVVEALFADSARALATFFGFDEMNFVVLNHEQQVYQLVVREGAYFPRFQPGTYTQPFGTGLLGLCHKNRASMLSNDVAQVEGYVRTDPAVQSELCVPVQVGDEVLAIIDSGASRVNAFTTAHLHFIEGFARYLAPAIADPQAFLQAQRPDLIQAAGELAPLAQSLNFLSAWHEEWRSRFAHLYAETAQRNAELLALITLSDALGNNLRLESILPITVAKVAQLFACQMSWIALPDDEGHLKVRAIYGETAKEPMDSVITADGSPQFLVFLHGEAIITNDLHAVPSASFDRALCRCNGITRYLAVPLRVRERTIGVMSIGRSRTAVELTEYDARLLSTFANHIALAIENADLYERSRTMGALEERNRVARDLHDTLTQSIVSILMTLQAVGPALAQSPLAVQEAVEQSQVFAKESLDEARRSIWNLTLAGLGHRGFERTLEDYVDRWRTRTGIDAIYQLEGFVPEVHPTVAMDVLHVAREALSNIVRHASASLVQVNLTFTAAGLRLSISDNGIGVNPDLLTTNDGDDGKQPLSAAESQEQSARLGKGLGLHSMRERARLLGGWLQIESAPGWGTRLVLTIPLGNFTESALPTTTLPVTTTGGADAAPEQTNESTLTTAALRAESVTTVVLADDHPAFLSGLRQALAKTTWLRIIGTATTGSEALLLVRRLRPDVLLLDVQLPDKDGIAILRELRAEQVPTRIVMLTAHFADTYIVQALQHGAAGFLQKDIEISDLTQAIRSVQQGHQALSPAIEVRVRDRAGLLVNPQASHFTLREREVLHLLAAGLRYQAIAQHLCISEATVKFHTINLYGKLQSHSRIEALNRAREWGLLH